MLLLPMGNFASLSYLKEDSKLRLLIDVCTMFAGALVSDSLLYTYTAYTYVTKLNLEKKRKLNV